MCIVCTLQTLAAGENLPDPVAEQSMEGYRHFRFVRDDGPDEDYRTSDDNEANVMWDAIRYGNGFLMFDGEKWEGLNPHTGHWEKGEPKRAAIRRDQFRTIVEF